MKIIPNQRFKHDVETYEKGKEYDVEDKLGYYFIAVGWVGDGTVGADATLEIHDALLGQKSEVTN